MLAGSNARFPVESCYTSAAMQQPFAIPAEVPMPHAVAKAKSATVRQGIAVCEERLFTYETRLGNVETTMNSAELKVAEKLEEFYGSIADKIKELRLLMGDKDTTHAAICAALVKFNKILEVIEHRKSQEEATLATQSRLNVAHTKLRCDYDKLKQNHDKLKGDYDGLETAHDEVKRQLQKLQADHDSLDVKCTALFGLLK